MVPLAHLELKLLCALLPKPRELLHPDLPLSPSPVLRPSLGHVRRQKQRTSRPLTNLFLRVWTISQTLMLTAWDQHVVPHLLQRRNHVRAAFVRRLSHLGQIGVLRLERQNRRLNRQLQSKLRQKREALSPHPRVSRLLFRLLSFRVPISLFSGNRLL